MSMVRAWLRFVRVSQFHEKNCSHDFPLSSVMEFLKALKVARSLEEGQDEFVSIDVWSGT